MDFPRHGLPCPMARQAYDPEKTNRKDVATGIQAVEPCLANWCPIRKPVGNRQERRKPAKNALFGGRSPRFRPTDSAEYAEKDAEVKLAN